jgi:hypothetical protein
MWHSRYILKIVEDVKTGRLKVDREKDELIVVLENPEHPGRCRAYGVVLWKFSFKGDFATYRSCRRKRRQCEQEERHQRMGQRLKEQEKIMKAEIEWRVATTISEMAHSGRLLQVQVDPIISPSACKSSCASTNVAEEQREIERVQVDDSQRYPVDDLCRRTPCEMHKPFNNITIKV